MRRTTKSVLLSALVFPGSGHFFLKQYLRGAALMVLATAGLALIVAKAVQEAMDVVEKFQYGQVPLDPQALSKLLAKSASGADGLVLDIATYGIGLCWLIGIVDSYRIGKRQDALDDRDRTHKQVLP